MKTFDQWPIRDRTVFVLDCIGVVFCTLLMLVAGFQIVGLLAIIFMTIGGTGIFLKNNPGAIKG